MGDVVTIIDKQQEQAARRLFRTLHDEGVEAFAKAFAEREEQRQRLATQKAEGATSTPPTTSDSPPQR